MNMQLVKKRHLTLIEIMIVMFLIAMIIGVLAYNYRGTLEEGKAFKTKTGIERLESILSLASAEDPSLLSDVESKWQDVVRASPLVKNANSLIKDGWGQTYQVSVENGEIKVRSEKYEAYLKEHPSMFKGQGQ